MSWFKSHKKALRRRAKALKRSMPTARKGIPSMLIAALLIASFTAKKPAHAYYGDDGGGAGRGALIGGLSGAAIGGAIGGGRGAGIGAGVGLFTGALIGGSRSRRGSDPYRQLNRLERKREKAMTRADKAMARAKGATSERRKNRSMSRAEKAQADVRSLDRQIANMKQNLGMKRQQGNYSG